MDTLRIAEAAFTFADVMGGDTATAYDCAPLFTCEELDALAAVLRATGRGATADAWIKAHAEQDEPGDCHFDWADWEGGDPDERCVHGRTTDATGCRALGESRRGLCVRCDKRVQNPGDTVCLYCRNTTGVGA